MSRPGKRERAALRAKQAYAGEVDRRNPSNRKVARDMFGNKAWRTVWDDMKPRGKPMVQWQFKRAWHSSVRHV